MKKNVLVILCDALRLDHVTADLTPNLLRIASRGLFYRNCFAGNTTTHKSMPPLLCGQPKYLPELSVMARLKRRGYKSTLLSTNPLVDRVFYRGWDRTIRFHPSKAYDKNFDRRLGMRRLLPPFILKMLKPIYRRLSDPSDYLVFSRAERILEQGSKVIDHSSSRFFLWIHLMDAHHPYYPKRALEQVDAKDLIFLNDRLIDAMRGKYKPKSEEARIWRKLYRMEVVEMDKAIGEFYDSVGWDDKILIITADHGDEHGEHGQWGHRIDKFVPELQRVPFIVVGDGTRPREVDDKFSHYDFPDLVLKLVK